MGFFRKKSDDDAIKDSSLIEKPVEIDPTPDQIDRSVFIDLQRLGKNAKKSHLLKSCQYKTGSTVNRRETCGC